jgi:hypothetical protein
MVLQPPVELARVFMHNPKTPAGSTTLLGTSTKTERDFRVKKLYMLFFASLLTLSCAAQPSPDISGDWEVKGASHNLTKSRLWITISSAGGMKAVLYSPYEDAEPVLVTSAVFEDSSLTLSVEPLHMYYRGKLSADGSFIAGSLSRGRKSAMVDFHRAFDGQPVTVERLEQLLAAASGKPDVQIAEQLYDLKLTERLSSSRLAIDEANLSGPEAPCANFKRFLSLVAKSPGDSFNRYHLPHRLPCVGILGR